MDRLRPSRRRAARATLSPNSASAASSAAGACSVSGPCVRLSKNVERIKFDLFGRNDRALIFLDHVCCENRLLCFTMVLYRSWPEYEQLNDLLQSGKSATILPSIAVSRSGQWNHDASRKWQRSTRPLPSSRSQTSP